MHGMCLMMYLSKLRKRNAYYLYHVLIPWLVIKTVFHQYLCQENSVAREASQDPPNFGLYLLSHEVQFLLNL